MTKLDFNNYKVRPSKHFVLGWMRKWNWNIEDLKKALENNYKLEKVGRHKYETYAKYGNKSRKIIFIIDEEYKEIFIITGAEGR